MSDWILLRTQQDEISRLITASGLEPLDFDLATVPSHFSDNVRISTLTHRKTGSYFEFDQHSRGGFFIRFSPGENEPTSNEYSGQWSYVLQHFTKWVLAVKDEL